MKNSENEFREYKCYFQSRVTTGITGITGITITDGVREMRERIIPRRTLSVYTSINCEFPRLAFELFLSALCYRYAYFGQDDKRIRLFLPACGIEASRDTNAHPATVKRRQTIRCHLLIFKLQLEHVKYVTCVTREREILFIFDVCVPSFLLRKGAIFSSLHPIAARANFDRTFRSRKEKKVQRKGG